MFRPWTQLPKHVAVSKQKTVVFGSILKDWFWTFHKHNWMYSIKKVAWFCCCTEQRFALLHRATVRAFFCRNSATRNITMLSPSSAQIKLWNFLLRNCERELLLISCSEFPWALPPKITSRYLKALNKRSALTCKPQSNYRTSDTLRVIEFGNPLHSFPPWYLMPLEWYKRKGHPVLCLWKHRGEAEMELQPTRNPALDGQHHAAAAFPLENLRYPLVQKAGLAQWTTWEIGGTPWFDLRIAQFVPPNPCW